MNTSEYLENISREYANYVIEERHIPRLSDGLKTAQRIALWLLKDQAKPVKTAGVVGRMMESGLYVHGDASAGDTISRMAAPYLNNSCMIQGEGTFGTRTAPFTGIGAPRYTEVCRSKFAVDNMYLDMDILPMRDNYDGSVKMPITFLPKLPMVLLNGIHGMAVGFACMILPRKISDLKQAVKQALETGKVTNKLLPYYEQYDCDIIKDTTKPNRYLLRGKALKTNTTTVHITEIPPELSLEDVKTKLIDLEDAGKITSFIDSSTDRINIEVKFPRAVLSEIEDEALVSYLGLVVPKTENLTVITPDGKPKTYDNPQDMVLDFVNHRLSWYKPRYEYLKTKEHEQELLLKSFISCFKGKTTVAKNIHNYKSKHDMEMAIRNSISSNGLQIEEWVVERILGYPAYRFTIEGYDSALEKLSGVLEHITLYSEIISSPELQKYLYLDEI